MEIPAQKIWHLNTCCFIFNVLLRHETKETMKMFRSSIIRPLFGQFYSIRLELRHVIKSDYIYGANYQSACFSVYIIY